MDSASSDPAADSNNKWKFPSLRKYKEAGISQMVTDLLRSLSIPGLSEHSSSHDFKLGSMFDAGKNKDVEGISTFVRGNWTYNGECTGFQYSDRRPHCLKAGRALGNWNNIFHSSPSPSIFDIDLNLDESEIQAFENLFAFLFQRLPFCATEQDHLWTLRNVMMGVIVELLPQVIEDLRG